MNEPIRPRLKVKDIKGWPQPQPIPPSGKPRSWWGSGGVVVYGLWLGFWVAMFIWNVLKLVW